MSPMRILITLGLGLLFSGFASAQPDDKPSLSGAGGAAGIGQYPPSSWGVTATTVSNPTAQDQNLLVTFNFEESSTLQFGVEAWIPAGCRRTVWVPMRTNEFEIDEYKTNTLPLRQLLIDRRGDQMVQLGEARGLLIAARDRWITGIIADGEADDDDSLSAALAMRRAVDMSRRLAYLNEQSLPSMVAGWQGMNGLVITKDKLELDSTQIEALRQWVLSGGKLWVMIEQVDPAAMSALLGDAWTPQVVDHVPLSRVAIEPAEAATAGAAMRVTVDDALNVSLDARKLGVATAGQPRAKALDALRKAIAKKVEDEEAVAAPRVRIAVGGAVTGEVVMAVSDAVRETGAVEEAIEREHETPVDFARVLPGDMRVTHTLSGWPAAMRKPIGKGWLLVTTVGPRGWIEPVLVPQINVDGSEAKNEKDKTIFIVGHVAHRPMRELGDWFHSDRKSDPLPPAAFESHLSEQIGHTIVGRGTVLLVLMLFCLALGGAGWWLSRDGRLEHLAWIGAGVAVVVAVVLILIGRANQTAVPMTVAQAQFVQIAPDQQQAIASGLVTIYNPGHVDEDATLAGTAGGLILPSNLARSSTQNIRMVWTDVDRWHWENVPMPGGANAHATFQRVTPLAKPVRAVVTFDERGAIGAASAEDFGKLSGMIIATPVGALATRGVGGGESRSLHDYGGLAFAAGPGDVLPPGQYVSSGVMDDVQRRRQEVYRALLGAPTEQSDDPMNAAIGNAKNRSGPRATATARRGNFPDAAVLLGWADAMPLGFEYPRAEQQIGTALVSIPLAIERPAAGTRITIPSPFLPYRVARGRFGATPAVFVEDGRSWNASSVPGTLPLAFKVPSALLPVKVTQATFKLDISAPGVGVEVLAAREGKLVSMAKQQSPSSVITVDVPAEAAQPDENGEITVAFRVTYPGTAERTLWRVRGASLEVKGEVVSPAAP